MTTDTRHIQACRNKWFSHSQTCEQCDKAIINIAIPGFYGKNLSFCPDGQILHEEFKAAILANPDCESIEGKPCTD